MRAIGLLLGPIAAVLIEFLVTPDGSGLTAQGISTLAVALWMASWWLTEAVPLAVTALLPLVLFPLLGVAGIDETSAPYANSIVFLFMGGFILGLAIERCGLHRRAALNVLQRAGVQVHRLIASFMVMAAGLSMWISNTAATIVLLPIAVSVITAITYLDPPNAQRTRDAIAPVLMLGIAYSASIGGTATLIGSPPNLVLAAFIKDQYHIEIDMLSWMAIGVPFAVAMLGISYLLLTRVLFKGLPLTLPGSRDLFAIELRELGPMSRAEKTVLVVFLAAVAGWLLRGQVIQMTGWTGLTDTVIAIFAAVALFVVPIDHRRWQFAMDWETARRLPWEILILFGGGLTLASAITQHGVDAWIASGLKALAGLPWVMVLMVVAAVVVFLTELTSNTAVTATLMPVAAAGAVALGVPVATLLVCVALAASCAFMLPVATPPNAIVFSGGYVTVAQMARSGFFLNVLAVLVIAMVLSTIGDFIAAG